jgi:hemerythrin superfamily protein
MKDLITNSLDSLLQKNDELIRIDIEIESFLKGLEKKILELDPKHEFQVNIKGTPSKIEDGISQFSWDENRYPKNQKTIEEILSKIIEKYNATKNNFKAKLDEFQSESEKLKLKMKSDTEAAGLMKTDYREIVRKTPKDTFIKTEYLTTMLCFVPT